MAVFPRPFWRSLLPVLGSVAIGLLGLGLTVPAARALDLRQRSVSTSRQFIVYCPDLALRGRVSMFAEELKGQWLQLLGETDHWKYPVLIVMEKVEEGQPNPNPVSLQLVQYEAGLKVQINVRIGDDPAKVNLQKHILRALFIEYAYRTHPEAVPGDRPFAEAPWWLVEGALAVFRTRAEGGFGAGTTDLFKRIVEANRMPPLDVFLVTKPDDTIGTTLQEVDRSCAMCLVQLLIEQPSGRQNLGRFVQHLPEGSTDALQALQREFAGLAQEVGGAQKWWTLNLARISAADRFKGLSPEETDAELAALLQFEIPATKTGEKKSFGIADFDEYLKLPASRPVLATNGVAVQALGTRANALYRGIVAEYDQIFMQLARGKTHGLKDRLVKVNQYREAMLHRQADITDYLNWFEATQLDANKKAFEGYIKAANELAAPPRRNDPITRYLDEISQEL